MARKKWVGGSHSLEGVSSPDEATMEGWLLNRLVPFDGPNYPDPHFHGREDKSLIEDHLSYAMSTQVREAPAPALPPQYDVRRMIQTLLGGFSLALRTSHLEWRVGALEAESRELRETLRSRLAEEADAAFNTAEIQAVMGALESVTEAAEQAFGVRPSSAIDLRSPGAERPFTVTLDFGKSPRVVVSKAREAGARRLFYETIVALLPRRVLDRTDFEFVFP